MGFDMQPQVYVSEDPHDPLPEAKQVIPFGRWEFMNSGHRFPGNAFSNSQKSFYSLASAVPRLNFGPSRQACPFWGMVKGVPFG